MNLEGLANNEYVVFISVILMLCVMSDGLLLTIFSPIYHIS